MGKASNRKKQKKLNPLAFIKPKKPVINNQINTSENNFLDYILNTNLESDLIPLNETLIQKLILERSIPEDELRAMSRQGFLYSLSRESFILPEY